MHGARRGLLPEEEAIGEGLGEAGLVGVGLELADVEHHRDAAVDHQVGDEGTGAGLERDVTVQAPEHGDGEAGRLAIGGQAKPIPDADAVEHDELRVGRMHLLGELLGGVGLAGSGAA